MTFLVGFCNGKFGLIGCDSLVKRGLLGDFYESKIARIGEDIILAHQGRLGYYGEAGMKPLTVQEICEKIFARGITEIEIKNIIQKVIRELHIVFEPNTRQELMILIRNKGIIKIAYYDSKTGMVKIHEKNIFLTNGEHVKRLIRKGKIKLIDAKNDSLTLEEVKNWAKNTIRAMVQEYDEYGGEPVVESLII